MFIVGLPEPVVTFMVHLYAMSEFVDLEGKSNCLHHAKLTREEKRSPQYKYYVCCLIVTLRII